MTRGFLIILLQEEQEDCAAMKCEEDVFRTSSVRTYSCRAADTLTKTFLLYVIYHVLLKYIYTHIFFKLEKKRFTTVVVACILVSIVFEYLMLIKINESLKNQMVNKEKSYFSICICVFGVCMCVESVFPPNLTVKAPWV